jgi:DNA topoisomerase-1
VLAAVALRALEGFESEAEAKRNVVTAIDNVARRLGNTRAVSRRSYVHPAVIESYLDNRLEETLTRRADRLLDGAPAIPSVEAAVLKLIRTSRPRPARPATRNVRAGT